VVAQREGGMEVGIGARCRRTGAGLHEARGSTWRPTLLLLFYIGLEAGIVVVSATTRYAQLPGRAGQRNYASSPGCPLSSPPTAARPRLHVRPTNSPSASTPGPLPHHHADVTLQEPGHFASAQRPSRWSKLQRNWTKYTMMPATPSPGTSCRTATLDLAEYAEDCPFNRIEMGDPRSDHHSGSAYVTPEALRTRAISSWA